MINHARPSHPYNSVSFYIVICPPPFPGPGVCAELCSSDDDCELDEKCCSNGCGHQCTNGTLCAVSRHKNVHLIHGTCMYTYTCTSVSIIMILFVHMYMFEEVSDVSYISAT